MPDVGSVVYASGIHMIVNSQALNHYECCCMAGIAQYVLREAGGLGGYRGFLV